MFHLQKHKEFVKTVKVEEIDGMKLVKNLAVKMEEIFRKKAEATRVSKLSYFFNEKIIFPPLVGLIREIGSSSLLIGAQRKYIYHHYLIYFMLIKEITQESSLILTI